MKRKKLALAVVLALLVVGVALGVHLTHKDAYAQWDYEVYIHSGESPITGLSVAYQSFHNGIAEDGDFEEVEPGLYRYTTELVPAVDFDYWIATISSGDVQRSGLVMVDPNSNPIPLQSAGTNFVDWEVAPDMR